MKRKLRPDEIQTIIADIPVVGPAHFKAASHAIVVDRLRQQLERVEICPQNIAELRQRIVRAYHTSLVTAGDNVGILTAQSIGERQTQLTLNTFHQSGLTVKTVVTGVPRFLELMNATKEPKGASCTITMSAAPGLQRIRDVREYIGDSLRCVTLPDLMVDYEILSWQDAAAWWLVADDDDTTPTTVLRIRLDPKRVYDYRCSLSKIVSVLNDVLVDMVCVCSSLNECIIDMFNLREDLVQLPAGVDSVAYVTEETKHHVFFEDVVLPRLHKLTLTGVDRIRDMMIAATKPFTEWEISTVGSNYKGIIELGKFDLNSVMTNNMYEIYSVLGIEATREFLVREFTAVISSDGTYINPCHVLLLVDTMTHSGDITSISRYSLRSKPSVLSRTSFEESVENVLKAGMFGEIDDIGSMSANIMTGKLSRVGTGICDVLMTDDAFQHDDAMAGICAVKPPYVAIGVHPPPGQSASAIPEFLPALFQKR